MVEKFEIKAGSLAPGIRWLVGLSSGQTLAGATAVFSMRNRDTGAVAVNAAPATVDEGAGTVAYDWQSGDTDIAGIYDAEFDILLGGTIPMIQPAGKNLIVVIAESI